VFFDDVPTIVDEADVASDGIADKRSDFFRDATVVTVVGVIDAGGGIRDGQQAVA
jgi:hypothetical protein